MLPTTSNLPLHDVASGIKNLDAHQARELRVIDAGATLAIGMVLGALIVLLMLLLGGCASRPIQTTDCVLLKFTKAPTPSLVQQLAATQPATTTAEVARWFAKGETGFILRGSHTNEISAAVAEGAQVTVIHRSGSSMINAGSWGEKL